MSSVKKFYTRVEDLPDEFAAVRDIFGRGRMVYTSSPGIVEYRKSFHQVCLQKGIPCMCGKCYSKRKNDNGMEAARV